jgi:hypothetical protein
VCIGFNLSLTVGSPFLAKRVEGGQHITDATHMSNVHQQHPLCASNLTPSLRAIAVPRRTRGHARGSRGPS